MFSQVLRKPFVLVVTLLATVPLLLLTQPVNSSDTMHEGPTYNNTSEPTKQSSAEVSNTSSGWTIETVDIAGEDTGWYTSLSLDNSGRPHISYLDLTGGELRYAHWTGSEWYTETVDSDIGAFPGSTSLTLDSAGYPHISYWGHYSLRYTWYDGSTWHFETGDGDASSSAGEFSSLGLDAAGHPHISYRGNGFGYDLKHAHWTGSNWVTQTVDSDSMINYTSLALDTDGHPHISYLDFSDDSLKYAYWTGSSWDVDKVSSADTLCSSSLTLDTEDRPHIAYNDNDDNITYARWTGATWITETVENQAGSFQYNELISLALDSSGNPHISYPDRTDDNLKYARWTGSTWDIQIVDSTGNVGRDASLALDVDDNPHISYRDATSGGLKYATLEANSIPTWTMLLYLDGDNNLAFWLNRAIANLEAQPDNPDLDVVVLLDDDSNNDSWRFLVQPGGNYSIGINKWHMGELNMGDPQTLVDFVTWAHEQYPAQHYYLSIADHGRGTSGIAWDDNDSHDYLSTSELRTALSTITNSGQWKIDVLHYDACLMGLFEHAYQVKDYADYLVFSENIGWSIFAYDQYARVEAMSTQENPTLYKFSAIAAQITASTTPQQLVVNIADAYFNSLEGYPRTISALDLSQAETVQQTIDSLATALNGDLDNIKNYIQNARSATQKFDSRDYFRITNDDEYVDLYHLAERLKQYVPNSTVQTAAQGVMDAITAGFVVAEHHQSGTVDSSYWDLDNAHGVAVYFPPRSGSDDYNQYVGHQLFQFTIDSQWDSFLADYFGVMGLPPDDMGDPGLPPMLQPQHKIYLPLVIRG